MTIQNLHGTLFSSPSILKVLTLVDFVHSDWVKLMCCIISGVNIKIIKCHHLYLSREYWIPQQQCLHEKMLSKRISTEKIVYLRYRTTVARTTTESWLLLRNADAILPVRYTILDIRENMTFLRIPKNCEIMFNEITTYPLTDSFSKFSVKAHITKTFTKNGYFRIGNF